MGAAKNKYNTGKPIDISKLSEQERKQAFHEWAEGSEALEQLLNEGYYKGFLSHACCGGDTGTPYIDYELNDENSRKIAMCIAEKLIENDLDCQITIYDNFLLNEADPEQFPTRDIISLNVQTKMENREQVFNCISSYIRYAELDKVKLPKTEDEIPRKTFKKDVQDKQSEFSEKLQTYSYTSNEIAKNDVKELDQKDNNCSKIQQEQEI